MRQIKIAMVLVPLVLAGCGGLKDLFGSKQSAAVQPLNCSRAPIEVIIARAGMACSDTNPCPSGSYCNASAVCAWSCYADSECATDQVCGCDGRCVGETPPGTDGGAPTSNQSCSKNATLLYKIKPGSSPTPIPSDLCDANGNCPPGSVCDTATNVCNWVRECDNDQRCPAGSYCDPATGRCNWDCHPDVACPTANQVCNCSGRCVIPGTAPGTNDPTCQPRKTISLQVSPVTSFIEGTETTPPSWTRTVTLTLSAPKTEDLVATNNGFTQLLPSAQTYVVPRANTQVFCNGNWTTQACALTRATALGPTTWLVETLGQAPDPVSTRVSLAVQVRAQPGVVAPRWHVDVFTLGAQNSPRGLEFAYDNNSATITSNQPPPTWQPGPLPNFKHYRGKMVIAGATDFGLDFVPNSPSAVPPATVQIYAQTLADGQLYLFDPTHTISASGTLTLVDGGGTPFYLVNSNDPRLVLKAHGDPTASILVGPGGALKGSVVVRASGNGNITVFTATFSLSPAPDGQPVVDIPTEAATNSSEPPYLAFDNWSIGYQLSSASLIASANGFSDFWIKDAYDYERGIATPVHVKKPPLVRSYFGVYPSEAGYEMCFSSFLHGYVEHLNTQYVGTDSKTYKVIAGTPSFDVVDMCSRSDLYTTGDRRTRFAPCVDGNTGYEDILRGQPSSGFHDAATCSAMYNNQFYSTTFPTGSYTTWRDTQCVRLGSLPNIGLGQLSVQINNLTNNTSQNFSSNIYICPDFKYSLTRIPTIATTPAVQRTDPTSAEATFCYDPNHSGSALLWSGYLTDGGLATNVLDFSGDLLCQGADGTTYAPKIFPLLTNADRVTRGEVSETLSASDLLDGCLKELHAKAPIIGSAESSPTRIHQTFFEVFSNPSCVSMPRFGLALDYFRDSSFPSGFAASPTVQDQRLLSHLFKQWIAVHSFIAYQGLEESKLRRVLASATDPASTPPVTTTTGPDPSALPPVSYEELLDLTSQSWEPILSMYTRRRQLLAEVVGVPDYRAWSGSLAAPLSLRVHQDEWLPLPVIMIEGLNQQMRLLRAFLEQAALASYSSNPLAPNAARDQALTRFGATMRLMYLVEAAAQDLYGTSFPDTNSLERWNMATEELAGLREDTRRTAAALGLGRNPLGIDEDDLPIFFGDPQGTNSQYFASSDYLVGQWAVPAVTAAEASIATARDAWLQARNSKIQDRMTQTQRDQRVDDLKATQGQKLVDNCGLTGVDAQDVLEAFQSGTTGGPQLQLDNCFIDKVCLGRIAGAFTPANIAGVVSPGQIQYRLCTLRETAAYRNLPEPMATCAATGDISNGCQVIDLFSDFNSGLVPPDAALRADDVCQARLGYHAPLPTSEAMVGPLNPSCYRGKMGASALQIIAAKQDIDLAVQNWQKADQSFRLDTAYCEEVEVAEEGAQQRADELKAVQDKYEWLKQFAGKEANKWEVFGSFGSLNPLTVIGSFFSNAQEDFVIEAQGKMDEAQEEYAHAMAIKQSKDTIRECWHNVNKSKLEIDAAYAQIGRRRTDATLATEQLKNMINENIQALRQGANDVKREKDRFISTVAHHYWLGEKLDRFNKDFAWAKRTTYLAMRAVEYEFQQSLPLRQSVLTASHPDQLRDALRILQQEVGTRTINRRRPSEASIVLSLRDEMMALPDHSADPTGERQLTPVRGLQQRLIDPRFAVYDKGGNWLGQGIPFNLGPEGALNYRCGERLWRITATVQGDGLSESQPGVSLLVLKRNTFASQWCNGQGDGSPLQYGSVQPSRRLFGEHGTGALESQSNGYSTALLYPWFNIRRTDFYKDSYRDGASEELAGRGLYGDYVLLFPRDVLEGTASETDSCVAVRRAFPLDQVEDVLIRFDYLSVDNLSDLQQ